VRDTIKGQLFGETMLGEFLKIRSDAVVEVEAWADTVYGVGLDPAAWSCSLDPGGKRLTIGAPPLAARVPAILTDTITVRVVDRSILVNEAKVAESMKAALTARFVEYAAERAKAPETLENAKACLEELARGFAEKAGLAVDAVNIAFAAPQ